MPPPNPVVEGHLLLPFSGFGDIPIKYRARTWAVSRIADCRKAGLDFFDFFFFYFIPWKPTDTWPRDRCGRAQLVLLPSLVDSLHLGADL